MMIENKDDQPLDNEVIEKWLENYFLDPLTTYYDQTQFRIDLYETDNEWIVEALLNDCNSSDITVYVEDKKLLITEKRNPLSSSINQQKQQKRTRSIEFPFPIYNHKIKAAFHNGILEVFISKIDKEFGKNRYITLP